MVSRFLSELQPSLSAPRLQRYVDTSGDPLQAAVNYLWNVALAESLYCSLHAVELAFRNGLHSSLTQHFGRPDWYDGRGVLDGGQKGQIEKAKKTIAAYGDTVTPDRIVSQVTFGFWVTILWRNYDARLWSANNSAPLKNAFLRLPKHQRQRHVLHTRYNRIRELRNRVMHHEPLFDDGLLMVRYGEVKQGLHWLNPRMVDWVEWYDRFPEVHTHGRADIERALKEKLNIP